MAHQILQDRGGRGLHVDITPVDPRVVWTEGSAEKPVSGLGHELSPARLRGETVTTFHILVDLLSKILLDDGDFAKVLGRIGAGLDSIELAFENRQGVVFRVGNEEGEIDQVVRIRKVNEMAEEHGHMRFSIAQRHADKNSLLPLPSLRGALDVRQVVVSHRLELEVFGTGTEPRGRPRIAGKEPQSEEEY